MLEDRPDIEGITRMSASEDIPGVVRKDASTFEQNKAGRMPTIRRYESLAFALVPVRLEDCGRIMRRIESCNY